MPHDACVLALNNMHQVNNDGEGTGRMLDNKK